MICLFSLTAAACRGSMIRHTVTMGVRRAAPPLRQAEPPDFDPVGLRERATPWSIDAAREWNRDCRTFSEIVRLEPDFQQGPIMTRQHTRREVLKGSLAAAGLGVLGLPEWALPALAQGETLVPFTDMPENVVLVTGPDRRIIDIRKIDGPFTPKDQFFTTQHYGHPDVDPADVPPEGLRAGGPADVALARRAQADAQHGARRRLRVLGQPPSAAGPLRQRPLDRRAAARRARQGGREARSARVRLLRRRSRRGRSGVPHATSTRSSSSSAAACRARRRCRPNRSWPTRSTASRSPSTRALRCGCSCRAGTASPT